MVKKWFGKSVVLVTLACIGLSPLAGAMASPNGIQWSASPSSFVASLYLSVLGRPKEPGPTGWDSQVTGNPSSRLKVFWGFVNSKEYRSKYGGSGGYYFVYWKSSGPHTVQYAVATGLPQRYNGSVAGPYSFGVATAVRNYYQTYVSRR